MTTCERSVLVEAALDGRLGRGERLSLERHLGTCHVCAERERELAGDRAALRELALSVPPLQHQRARLALLRKAAAPHRTAPRRHLALLAAGIAFVPLVVWAASGRLTRHPDTAPAPAVSVITVERILPAPVVVAPPLPSAIVEPSASVAAPPPPRPARSRASRDFADAMESVSRGDFGVGAEKLERFTHEHPQDARAEEALYLQAIALERAGRTPEAKVVAHRYLTTYPDGAHEQQARQLAGE